MKETGPAAVDKVINALQNFELTMPGMLSGQPGKDTFQKQTLILAYVDVMEQRGTQVKIRLHLFADQTAMESETCRYLNERQPRDILPSLGRKLRPDSHPWPLFVLWLSHIARYAPSPAERKLPQGCDPCGRHFFETGS